MRELRLRAQRACTLRDFLQRDNGFSVTAVRNLKKNPDAVRVNGKFARMVDGVTPGDEVYLLIEDHKCTASPNFQLYIKPVYEDEDVIVYDKPAGMPAHQSPGHRDDTLANVFAAHCEKCGIESAFRPINRLDRDTTGLIAAAKNPVAAFSLGRTLEKEYTAICEGSLEPDSGTIDAPIAREDGSVIKRTVDLSGQRAVTHFTVIFRAGGATAVRVLLETGRTHQIRVHFAHIGHPLLGDELYAGSGERIARQALHCSRLEFIHPFTGEKKVFVSLLPEDMNKVLKGEKA